MFMILDYFNFEHNLVSNFMLNYGNIDINIILVKLTLFKQDDVESGKHNTDVRNRAKIFCHVHPTEGLITDFYLGKFI